MENPSPASINLYINWVLYAVLGRTAEADNLLRKHRAQVYAMARWLEKRRRPKVRELFRGVLLEPREVRDGLVYPDPRLTFLSFTEDFDVACWFADPASIISGHVRDLRPGVEGWILKHRPQRSEILWHYSWDEIPVDGRSIPLVAAGAHHPHVMEELSQLAWNIQTQREVILKPLPEGTPVTAYELEACPDTEDLDRRLAHPLFRGNPPPVRRPLIERAKRAFAEMQVAKDQGDYDAFMRAYRRGKASFDAMTDEEAAIAREEIEGPIWTGE